MTTLSGVEKGFNYAEWGGGGHSKFCGSFMMGALGFIQAKGEGVQVSILASGLTLS